MKTDIAINAIEKSEKKKKISFDINEEMLNMIDELAKLSHCTRSQILTAIIFPGTRTQIKTMIIAWKDWVKEDVSQNKDKQERMKKLIKEGEKFQKKWGLEQYPKLLKEAMDKTKEMNSKKR